jgi:hypothetical protein
MDVCCECCVLSCRGFYHELITRPEESYLLWCVVVCDIETSRMRRPWPWPTLGRRATRKKNKNNNRRHIYRTLELVDFLEYEYMEENWHGYLKSTGWNGWFYVKPVTEDQLNPTWTSLRILKWK